MTARNGLKPGAGLGAPPVPGNAEDGSRPRWVPLAAGAALAFGLAWLLFRNSAQAPSDQGGEEDEQEGAPDVEYLPPESSGSHESYELEEAEDVEVEPA